jgi:hypothetical protein
MQSEGSIKEEKKKRGMNPDQEAIRESTLFLEHKDGSSVRESEARQITAFMRKIFNDLQRHGYAPANWRSATAKATMYLYQEMYRRFPFLFLCETHWKIERLASLVYPQWQRVYRTTTVVKVEDVGDEEKTSSKRKQSPTSSKQTKPSKQIKSGGSTVSFFSSLLFILNA